MKCLFQRWCRKKPENCALYWEGRQDQAIITAMIPVIEALKKAESNPILQRDFARLREWNPCEKTESNEEG